MGAWFGSTFQIGVPFDLTLHQPETGAPSLAATLTASGLTAFSRLLRVLGVEHGAILDVGRCARACGFLLKASQKHNTRFGGFPISAPNSLGVYTFGGG